MQSLRSISSALIPFRDPPEILADYVTFYRPEFLGVTGTPDHVFQLVEALGLYYRYASADGKNPFLKTCSTSQKNQNILSSHSSHILLITPEGQVGAMITQPFEPSRLLTIYKKLIKKLREKGMSKNILGLVLATFLFVPPYRGNSWRTS